MDTEEIIVFLLAVGLAVTAVMGIFRTDKRGRAAYLAGMGVGTAFGVLSVLNLGWNWTIGLALGMGSIVLAPAAHKVASALLSRKEKE